MREDRDDGGSSSVDAGSRELGALEERWLTAQTVAVSFVILVQELALIRWLPSQVRVVAYYPNLVLISAFCGLGIGALASRRRSWRGAWPALTLLTVACGIALGKVVFTQESVSEHLFLLYYDLPPGSPVVKAVWPPILALFILTAATFVPLGQVLARRLEEFRHRGRPLQGYSWDLVGSLLGVVGFTVLGTTGSFPVVWFAAFLVPGLLIGWSRRGLAAYVLAALAVLGAIVAVERAESYSPYYALRANARPGRLEVTANGSLHQIALPLQAEPPAEESAPPEARPGLRYTRTARVGYTLPYRLLGRPPGRTLVLGAGTGNDVAVALAMGAEHVDAVEIDPVILEVGRQRHPSRPYDSPRVRLVNADARAFLKSTSAKYDVVVLGTLDSMTRLSALSSVRLDNFVYTKEGLRAIREHLSEKGALIMYFMVSAEYIDARLAGMVAEAFGELPQVETRFYGLFNRVYMAGPGFAHVDGERRRAATGGYSAWLSRNGIELPADDWPYLYLAERGVSRFHWALALAFAGVAVLGVLVVSPAMRQGLRRGAAVDGPMICFGAGFLLIETRAATEMNLVWSATWLTSAVVFAAILATILAATVLAARRPVPYGGATLGVTLALLVTWATPTASLLQAGWPAKLTFSLLFVGVPAFFASLCFASVFRTRTDSTLAIGWNLLGAVAGGLTELTAMELGFKALHLLAAVAYLLAYLLGARRQTPGVETEPRAAE